VFQVITSVILVKRVIKIKAAVSAYVIKRYIRSIQFIFALYSTVFSIIFPIRELSPSVVECSSFGVPHEQ